MAKEVFVTAKGLQDLKDELDKLKSVDRKEVAEKIKIARGYGDLSENAEYDAAKEEQGKLEAHIADLEVMIKNAKVIDSSELTLDNVQVGMTVKIQAVANGMTREYAITGSTEADVKQNRISDESPLGKGLLGHKIGEIADVILPNGTVVQYEVLEIRRTQH